MSQAPKSHDVKHELFTHFARVAKALGHANRLELLEFLAQGERSVDSLARASGLSVANTSQHLRHLRQAGLVSARKEGQHVHYRLNGEDVLTLLTVLRQVAENHVAEIERLVQTYLKSRDELEPIHARELLDRTRTGLVTVIDVRPEEEFAAGHLPDALNIPLEELEASIADLPTDREIIAYCRGPYCLLAFEAVTTLREQGLNARRLEYGFPEWQQAGLPVASSR